MSDTTWLSELIRLRELQGNPSTRKIADPAGLSHTTVAETLSGRRFPSLPTLLRIVRALDDEADDLHFIELWRTASERGLQAAVGQERLPSERELLQAILDELVLIRQKLDA